MTWSIKKFSWSHYHNVCWELFSRLHRQWVWARQWSYSKPSSNARWYFSLLSFALKWYSVYLKSDWMKGNHDKNPAESTSGKDVCWGKIAFSSEILVSSNLRSPQNTWPRALRVWVTVTGQNYVAIRDWLYIIMTEESRQAIQV